MKHADLHVHTFFSDSTFSPREVVERAVGVGLSAIAICDHDSVDGIGPCREAVGGDALEIIPGIELTAEKADAEIHILGYFFDWQDERLRRRLAELQAFRVERMHRIVARLNDEGVGLTADEVFAVAGKGSVGRLHIAQALHKARRIRTHKEAFDRYIGFGKPCYISNIRFTPQEAIALIRKSGGVPVVAHPGILGRDDYITELIDYGLRGVEAFHTDHKPSVQRHYAAFAAARGLIATGGSDCHGMGKGRVLLGGVRVPYTVVEALKDEAEAIRRAP